MLNDILFFGSVLTFSAAAILGYWQVLCTETDGLAAPVVADSEPKLVPEPVPAAI